MSSSLLQLEKLIGKLKTDKLGRRIIDLIQQFTSYEASESREKEEHQKQMNVKRRKKNKTIESGEDGVE